MKVLFVSNLFPNQYEPARGIFNFHQMRHLSQRCEVQALVPYDWFFVKGRFAPPGPLPATEDWNGLHVHRSRNYYLPKIGRTLNPLFYALSARGPIARIRKAFPFDVLFVNWAYPDGCGMAKVAHWLGVPFVVSISGSDVNLYLTWKIRRRQILRMLAAARAITVRSRALRDLLLDHGVPAGKIHVLYNGVDPDMFSPQPATPASHSALLYVGRLSPEKGVADLLAALALLRRERPDVKLRLVGGGAQRGELEQQARSLGLDGAVQWVGWKKPAEIAEFMSAADILCLPSHMEGVPNAALEAFACGVPVVATRVGGIPEVVSEQTGVLAPPRDPAAFATALKQALTRPWDTAAIRAHATRFDWNENARQLFAILSQAKQETSS